MDGASDVTIDLGQAVAGPAGPVPPRRERSIRRTSTIDMTWPAGIGTQLRLDGRARDIVSLPGEAEPVVVGCARVRVGVGPDRVIEDILTDPSPAGVDRLVGERGGGHLRMALARRLPLERRQGSPLYLLLDDISGSSLIAGVAWSRWPELTPGGRRGAAPDMEGVCIGFAPRSSAIDELRESGGPRRVRAVGSLVHADDPHGWHELPSLPPVSTRRARHIDVRVESQTVIIDAGFQDSAGDPDHGRVAVHEYRLQATADLATMTLRTLEPVAHVLPFRECPAAVRTATAVVGTPIEGLRETVLDRLATTRGCTHLNDALRSLAEVPVLVDTLADVLR